ncbi:alpha/beta fold hydrolase [Nitratireductor aestuarii]|nr:alpha/beta hydrolase [Nitratireductor aestuarii]
MQEISCHPMRFFADPVGKPPLLLMHGMLSSRNHWRLNEAALRSRYRLIIAELPGHGETRPSEPYDVRPDALVEAIEQARITLDIPRWHICGQSFGAGLVLRYALKYPEYVGALVWTNANRLLADPLTPDQLAVLHARADKVDQLGLEGIRSDRVYPGNARYFPAEIREILKHDADGSDYSIVADIIRHALGHVTVRDRVRSLRVPTLLVNGMRERAFQPWRQEAAEMLPFMEVVDLDGGHSINIEQAEAFNEAVMNFLPRYDSHLEVEKKVALCST